MTNVCNKLTKSPKGQAMPVGVQRKTPEAFQTITLLSMATQPNWQGTL